MSLLADLLSKTKTGAARGGNKSPSLLDIPPTLSKVHGITSKVPKIKSRYIVITVVSVVFIALGAFMIAKFGLRGSSARKNPAPPPQSKQHIDIARPGPFRASSLETGLAPPGGTPPIEQPQKPRITLGEPAVPVPAKKKFAPHKVSVPRSRPPCPDFVPAGPKLVPVRPVRKIERSLQQAAQQPRPKGAVSAKIDTAARDSLLYAARSAEQASDWKSALGNYRKAKEIDPGNYKIMSNIAAALNNLGMFDEGVQEAERALSKKPDYVPALINAAIGYSTKGNTQKALRLFTYASAIDPGNRNLTINLGILHERSGNLDEAQATYRQLATAGDPQALQGMGRIYELKGNKSEAARTYRQILRIAGASAALKRETKGKLERLEEQ